MYNQNINNRYSNVSNLKLNSASLYDLTLSIDNNNFNKEVVFSDKLMYENDGNTLPINIDLNSVLSNRKLELLWNNYYSGNTLVSKNYYNPNNEDLTCLTATSLCDIGLTGIDVGLYNKMTGETITFTMGINDDEKFNPHYYDRRFKMHPVGTYANNPNHRLSGNTKTVYNIVSDDDCHAGYYNELYGGFYQGFYKLHGYDYEVFPERVPKGWTMEAMLKPRQRDKYEISSGETYLNDVHSGSSGTFFFFGARAENKFFHPADGKVDKNEGFGCKTCNISVGFQGSDIIDCDYDRVTSGLTDCIKTCACSDTGVTSSNCIDVYPKTATTQVHTTGPCGSYTEEVEVKLDLPSNDMYSNALSIRFSGDPANPKICVKYISLSGGCITSGSCETSGLTYCSGYTVDEVCSTGGIYDLCEYGNTCDMSGTTERWVMISAVFERYETLENCDLLNWGGLGDIRYLAYDSELNGASYNMILPPFTHPGSEKEIQNKFIRFNQKWIDNTDKRRGLLKIYVNGFLFMVIEDFEEIIPHELNTEKEKQLGVPYNISFGGGTQGLRESLVFSGCSGLTGPYIQDPELMSNESLEGNDDPGISAINSKMIMESNFGGTFMGGISQFRMYTKSLSSAEIQHNFRNLKNRYDLFDFWCPNCSSCFCGVDLELNPNPLPSSTPQVTPTSEVTSTPQPTSTAEVTPTADVTSTPQPTPTAEVTPTADVTSTPQPTPTAEVTPTSEVTPTADVTSTPQVTPTSEVTSTPQPTPTPTTTTTPSNSVTPSVTITPTITTTPSSTPVPTINTFTIIGTTSWTAPAGVTSVEYLVVGGGGGGGNGYDSGGGGGAGGGMVLTGTLSVTPGNSYTVTVGDGGIGGADTRANISGTDGGSSVFDSITATGGQGGYGSRTAPGGAGVGGDAQNSNITSGRAGNGGAGGSAGGGGGGAGGNGTNRISSSSAGVGGVGITSSISGFVVTYGGGGNGGTANVDNNNGAAGTANTGKGGGAGSATGSNSGGGGNGGSGVVVLKYLT